MLTANVRLFSDSLVQVHWMQAVLDMLKMKTDNVLKSNRSRNRNDIASAANLKTFLDKSIFASVFIQRHQWLGKPKSVN